MLGAVFSVPWLSMGVMFSFLPAWHRLGSSGKRGLQLGKCLPWSSLGRIFLTREHCGRAHHAECVSGCDVGKPIMLAKFLDVMGRERSYYAGCAPGWHKKTG